VRKLANTVLFKLNPEIELLAGSTKARELLIKTSLEYLDSLAAESGNDSRLQMELATAYEKIGDVQGNPNYANLGHAAAALESYGKAAAIARKLGPSPQALEVLATAYSSMGTVQATQLGLRSTGRDNLRLATTIADSIPTLTGMPAYRLRLLMYGFLGDLDAISDPTLAAEPLRRSLDIAREWTRVDPGGEPKFLLAVVTREWADILWLTGDLNGARNTLSQSLADFQRVLAHDLNNGDWIREQHIAEERMGVVSGDPDYFNLGDRRAAAYWLKKYVQGQERLLAADQSDVRARFGLSEGLAELAAAYRDSEPRRSEKLYRRSLILSGSALQSSPADSDGLYWQSFERIGFASLLQRLGKRTQAMEQLDQAVKVTAGLERRDSTNDSARQLLGVALHRRASYRLAAGDARGAAMDLKRSEQILATLYQQHPTNLALLRDLADCYREMGALAAERSILTEARRDYQRSLDLWEHWTEIGKSTVYDQRQRELATLLVNRAMKHLEPKQVSASAK